MHINREFIHDVVSRFHEYANLKESDWCNYSKTTPTNANYSDGLYQCFYALRFIPAYYFEYCKLASMLNDRLNERKENFISIASLGFGLAPDYYALTHNLQHEFTYTGYDPLLWEQLILMPETSENFFAHQSPIEKLPETKIHKHNVFIFPKSISDINNKNNLAIDQFAKKLATTPHDRIFFLNSFIVNNSSAQSTSIQHFKKIHLTLINKGFSTQDNPRNTFNIASSSLALKSINSNFDYPNEKKINCTRINSTNPNCNTCEVIKNPIFTKNFIDYQLMEYQR